MRITPCPDTFVYFNNQQKQLPCPFAVYADTEAICQKVSTCSNDPESSFSNVKEVQIPCSVGAVLVVRDDSSNSDYQMYRG